MDKIDTSGRALVDFWKYAGDKGLMNANTASALRAACTQVLSVIDDWEVMDALSFDEVEIFRRFQNKRSMEFKPESLDAYKRRFSQALKLFRDYVNDPASWKARGQTRNGRKKPEPKSKIIPDAGETISASSTPTLGGGGLVEYPFPLRQGRLAYLKLPTDLTLAEVKRLTAYLATLAVDSDAAA